MARFCVKKKSKTIAARKRMKIEKKVCETTKKTRKEGKKNLKAKSKLLQASNQCLIKEEILQEIETMKKQKEEEKKKARDEAREEKRAKLASTNFEAMVTEAENKQIQHEIIANDTPITPTNSVIKEENSLKAYYKEFKKVLDAADVILEVVDARDPLGTRCKQVEEAVRLAPGKKKLVLVVNKVDLVPRNNLDAWLKYLRLTMPAVPFKASTQDQAKKLGRKKLGSKKEDGIQSNTCFGAEILLSILGNYCRSQDGVKRSIRVGIVGLPNVGKSSIINSLKRNRACSVGSTPGITKAMQIVQLDSKVQLLDSPGIVFSHSNSDNANDSSIALKNAVKIQALKDPYTPATAILKRIPKQQIKELYGIQDYATPDEFFARKAEKMGLFKKGGIPDVNAAARSILNDWNSGKIRYFTEPPEYKATPLEIGVVGDEGKVFNIEQFAEQEQMMLDNVTEVCTKINLPTVDSVAANVSGPADAAAEMAKKLKLQQINEKRRKKNLEATVEKKDRKSRLKKAEPIFEIEGNQRLNKVNKLHFKKQKKERARRERATTALADQLDSFNLNTDDLDLDEDVNMI